MKYLKSFENYTKDYTILDISGYSLYDLDGYIPFSEKLKIFTLSPDGARRSASGLNVLGASPISYSH
jgi:hypothetical protein